MYLPKGGSRTRIREAQNARNNRAEVVRALSQGQVTRRELMRWGVFTATGALALKNGLSPYAPSAYAGDDIPTGTPRSPLYGVQPFTQPLPRLDALSPYDIGHVRIDGEKMALWPDALGERPSKRLSYHTDFTATGGAQFKNPWTDRGPIEGRAPGELFAHQRWEEYFPKVGYRLSLGRLNDEIGFHPDLPYQNENSFWTFGAGGLGTRGRLPPVLIKARYGEPIVTRVYNSASVDRAENYGFGRNEFATHFHNAHNASASDGASNCHHFPGTFFDYHWATTLARAEERLPGSSDLKHPIGADMRASGPDDDEGLVPVAGDFRELQGSMWFHDHRFFFTAENVYKGHLGFVNQYSGPDRGHERLKDGVNLRLPSGWRLPWGNLDFDVNLVIADWATDQDGQYFFDIFNTDGFLGDNLHVNFAYAPYMEVLPRKYRFRLINCCMSRFIQLCFVDEDGRKVRFKAIANDGNLLNSPVRGRLLDQMGTSERFDVIVDFSEFSPVDKVWLVNVLEHKDGRGPDDRIGHRRAMRGRSDDPAVGAFMEFRVATSVESVDAPGEVNTWTGRDRSRWGNRMQLTEQIEIVEPDNRRHIEWKRGGGDDSLNDDAGCVPDCGEKEEFPWAVRVNGEETHTLNANRISSLVPEPDTVEHWTIENGGGGWDHPIHLHFEEGVTMNRGDDAIPETEYLVRKDVWRLREGGEVAFQVKFGEYGGSYVSHCHNTVHEDFAMLMRFDLLNAHDGAHAQVIDTPNPTPDGVEWLTPEILPEGDPRHEEYFFDSKLEAAKKTMKG